VTPGGWISDVTDDGLNPGKDYVRFALVPTMKKVKEACERMQKL
jgi:aspartate/methionine/tyrosine aminotransferase